MIKERMLELLSLAHILDNWGTSGKNIIIEGKEYSWIKIYDKYIMLVKELISPYVIDKDSKE